MPSTLLGAGNIAISKTGEVPPSWDRTSRVGKIERMWDLRLEDLGFLQRTYLSLCFLICKMVLFRGITETVGANVLGSSDITHLLSTRPVYG